MPITPEQFNEAVSLTATEYVRYLGQTLLNWKGVEVIVIFDPTLKKHAYYSGGPIVTAVISFGPSESDWKRLLYDVAKNSARLWNPLEAPSYHKVISVKGDKVRTTKGEFEFLLPMKFCSISKSHSITIKGPDGVSVTIEDKEGRRMESDMIMEARLKLSRLIHWENEKDE